MTSAEEWCELIENAPRAIKVTAHSYRGIRFKTFTMPFLVGCDDGHDYVVKPATSEDVTRSICSDQIMGHIAATIGAPVPPVRLVEISQSFLQLQPTLTGVSAGIAHGSRYLANISKKPMLFQFCELPQNRTRFALLSIMYGLAGVDGDHQFFYEDSTKLVWSVDHGLFFHYSTCWTIDTLKATPLATPDKRIVSECSLVESEIVEAAKSLLQLVDAAIAKAVASPVDAWNIIIEERVALAEHFRSRADKLMR